MDHSLSSHSGSASGALLPASAAHPQPRGPLVVSVGCLIDVRYRDGRAATYRLLGGAQTGRGCVPLGSPLSAALLGAGLGEIRRAGIDGEPFEVVAIRPLAIGAASNGGRR